jgi:transposase
MNNMLDPTVIAAAIALDIEGKTWLYPGVKEHVVRESLGLSMTTYYQWVNRLLDTELALQLDSLTTHRLQRKRDRRRVA